MTLGDPIINTAEGIRVGTLLLQDGFAPYVPHLTTFWHFARPQSYETWMTLDFAWLDTCDALYRMPGESKGADREVARALDRGIPVFLSLDTLYAWRKTWKGGR